MESIIRNSGSHDVRFAFIDNGSTDGTYEFLASKNPARLIRNERNMGVSYAWNQGLYAALELKPDVVVLLNNDVIVGPRWLDPVVRELQKPEKRYFLPNGNIGKPETFDKDVLAALPSLSGVTPARAGWCLFFTASAVKTFLPIPNELFLWFGDDYIHYKLQKAGYKCLALLECCCFHFVSRTFYATHNYDKIVHEDKAHFDRIIKEEEEKEKN